MELLAVGRWRDVAPLPLPEPVAIAMGSAGGDRLVDDGSAPLPGTDPPGGVPRENPIAGREPAGYPDVPPF